MAAGTGTSKAATSVPQLSPAEFASGKHTAQPQAPDNETLNTLQSAMALKGNGAQLPVMANSQAGTAQGTQKAQQMISDPMSMLKHLTPAPERTSTDTRTAGGAK